MPPITRVVKILLILNIAIFALGYFLKIELGNLFGLRNFISPQFNVVQIITHVFIHANFSHLLSNMFALFMFGPMVERALGEAKFIVFYLICAIGAAMLFSAVSYWEISQLQQGAEFYLLHPSPDNFLKFIIDFGPQLKSQLLPFINDFSKQPLNTAYIEEANEFVKSMVFSELNQPMVGASGAIFGILMGFAYLFPNVKLMLLFPPIPLKAKYFIAIYAVIELFAGVRPSAGDNVAHFAHIGGMVFAFVLLKIWNINRNTFY